MEGRCSYEDVLRHVDPEETIALLRDLIRIPSHFECSTQEEDVAKYIHGYLAQEGVSVVLREVAPQRPNVIARIPGSGRGRSLMLNGHTDTVIPYLMEIDPYDPVIKGGKVYGLGAADMKGGLASVMSAILAIHRSGTRLDGDLYFTAVVDEERKSIGAEDIIRKGPKTDLAIVAEPRALRLSTGHKGIEWLEIVVRGKPAHSGAPHKGVNAIWKAVKFLNAVQEQLLPELSRRVNKEMGPTALHVGRIEGGTLPSVVPGECRLYIERTWIPEETLDQVFGDIRGLVQRLSAGDPDFTAEVNRDYTNMSTMDHLPLLIQEDHILLNTLAHAIRWVTGKEPMFDNIEARRADDPAVTTFGGWTDGALLSNYGGIDTIVFGPGNGEQGHSPNEYIQASEVVDAAKILTVVALDLCRIRDKNKH